jgi:DNA-binding NarL/FixJ family response regulator
VGIVDADGRGPKPSGPWCGSASPATLRVAIVDDDEVNRRGMGALLSGEGRVRVVAELSHAQALAWDREWEEVDVLLIDAADERAALDHFPGVTVVERLRSRRSRAETRVVVYTGHFFDDAVRRRMREAGADAFYHRSELGSGRAVREAVLGGEAPRPVPEPADPELEFRHGITEETRVNLAVRFALERELPARLGQRPRPRSRSWARLRREFNRVARLTAVTVDGRPPDRPQELPSLAQIARFLAWATRVKAGPRPR